VVSCNSINLRVSGNLKMTAFKFKMTRIVFLSLFLVISLVSSGQNCRSLPNANKALSEELGEIDANSKISADSAFRILSKWNKYPNVNTRQWYLFLYNNAIFGTVPLKIYIPENYKSDVSSPAILILHGAVGLGSFADAYKDTLNDDSLFYNYFAQKNFIVIRPFADTKVNFDWVINRFNGISNRTKTNYTFQTLCRIVNQLKQVLNIDDNKVFALGHSDGADGVFALEVYKPTIFAAFVAYNSMLLNLTNYDLYLRNTVNRPLYLVHSDLDDLRPIQQTRLIVKILDLLHSPVHYKEYVGYQHYDKHLKLDLPYSYKWIQTTRRNPFSKNITWELSDLSYNGCDWLQVTQFDTSVSAAKWQKEPNTKTYNKRDKIYSSTPYYDLNKSAVVKASYDTNVFDVQTSRVKEIEILINPEMVNLQKPVIVKVNSKEVFNKKVIADKNFILKTFASGFDRKAIYVTSIKIKTSNRR
jgi:predicted esterase